MSLLNARAVAALCCRCDISADGCATVSSHPGAEIRTMSSPVPPGYTGASAQHVESDQATRMSVLVVEDEANIRELVCLHLGLEHLDCVQAAAGDAGLKLARERRFDLVILDLMLPGLDGVTVCRAIRKDSRNGDVPILMLTARREESDKVVGLDSGADDYLTKPFGVRELVARARALLRRPRQSADRPQVETAVVRIHGLEVDLAKRRVRVEGRDVELTDQEFRLLHLLASHAGIV